MDLLTGDDFTDLFLSFKDTAFHLELSDTYHVPEESVPLAMFLAGRHDDFSWHQPWLKLVRHAVQAGKRMTRVRVVSMPHSDYVRWGLTVAPLNIDAGEEIRWLPRHLAEGIDFPAGDYWLFDDRRVVFTVFHEDGRFIGGAETADPRVIEQCLRVHDQVWTLAIPHAEYIGSEYCSSA